MTSILSFVFSAVLFIFVTITTGFLAGKLSYLIINLIYKKYDQRILIIIPLILTIYLSASAYFQFFTKDLYQTEFQRLTFAGSYIATFIFFSFDVFSKKE